MGSIGKKIRWKERSESIQSIVILCLVIGSTFGGYGILCLAMGTPTPLVVVISESMEPNLYVGDLLILQVKAPEDIQVDDIIVFQDKTWEKDTRIVHRVVDIQEIDGILYYYTEGDNNDMQDPGERTYDEIIGVVVGRIPLIGNVSIFVREFLEKYWLLVIVILVFVLIIPEIVKLKEDVEETDNPSTDNVSFIRP